ncbi:MAG: hypothetical protein AB2A00_35465 [Myxococcota bacterium]
MKRITSGKSGWAAGVFLAAVLGSCGTITEPNETENGGSSSSGGISQESSSGSASSTSSSSSTSGGGTSTSSTGSSSGGSSSGWSSDVRLCDQAPPPGAPAPAPLRPYSGGTCPSLVEGRNLISTNNVTREFLLHTPANAQPGETFPVVFFWHWLGASADDFVSRGELVEATTQQRFIAVVPESIGAGVLGFPSLDVKWPFDVSQSQERMDEEMAFFDDMLTCVAEQFPVNRSCVSSAGVSAGALFTAQLASLRGDVISSFVSLSGGTGGVIRPWGNPDHRMPALVLSGGPEDNCFNLLNFEQQSHELVSSLAQRSHFIIECKHNCGHTQPPTTPPPGLTVMAPFWDFLFAHPFWLPAGDSPYNASGLPTGFPEWCAIGAGQAVPRTGECPNGSEC